MPIKWDKDKKKKVVAKKPVPAKKQPVVQQPKVETLRSTVLLPLEQTVNIIPDNKDLNEIITGISKVIQDSNDKTEQIAKTNIDVVTVLLDKIKGLDKSIDVKVEMPPDNKKPIVEWVFDFKRDYRGLIDSIDAKAKV